MTLQRKLWFGVIGWLATVTMAHLWLNTRLLEFGSYSETRDQARFRVGFLPVT